MLVLTLKETEKIKVTLGDETFYLLFEYGKSKSKCRLKFQDMTKEVQIKREKINEK